MRQTELNLACGTKCSRLNLRQGCTNPERRVYYILYGSVQYLRILATELSTQHPADTQNSEVAPRFGTLVNP